jgi:hypothetical protein
VEDLTELEAFDILLKRHLLVVRRLSHPPSAGCNLSYVVVAEFLLKTILVILILHSDFSFASITNPQEKSRLVVKGRLHSSRNVLIS